MTEAIQFAQKQLSIDLVKDPAFMRQMLLIEARYVSENNLAPEFPKLFPKVDPVIEKPRWFWVIAFVHPISNDVSFAYCVDQFGQVKLLRTTT